MFTFKFSSYSKFLFQKVIHHPKYKAVIWKLTVSGPYVTLYADPLTNEFSFLFKNDIHQYLNIMPRSLDHILAHDENTLSHKIWDSRSRHSHIHIVLPCKENLIKELNDLLKLICSKNNSNEILVNPDLIEDCIVQYEHYLNTCSLQEYKKNIKSLMIAFFYRYKSIQLDSTHSTHLTLPDLAIVSCLYRKNSDAFDNLRSSLQHFFDDMAGLSKNRKKELKKEFLDLIPHLSNDDFNKLPLSIQVGMYLSLFIGYHLLIFFTYSLFTILFKPDNDLINEITEFSTSLAAMLGFIHLSKNGDQYCEKAYRIISSHSKEEISNPHLKHTALVWQLQEKCTTQVSNIWEEDKTCQKNNKMEFNSC